MSSYQPSVSMLMTVYLAGLVKAGVVPREWADQRTDANLGFAIVGMEDATVYEFPLYENSDRAVEQLISLGIPRDYLFISHGAVYTGFKSHVVRELV